MAIQVDYDYYRKSYGGLLPEAAFITVLPEAVRHVEWFCGGQQPSCSERVPYKRAICAVCEVFAHYGRGQIGGFSIGDFRMTQYEGKSAITGTDMANMAVEMELCSTSLIFCGVR